MGDMSIMELLVELNMLYPLLESLNSPYSYDKGISTQSMKSYRFTTKENDEVTVRITENTTDSNEWDVNFSRNLKYDSTGGGDAFKIFATVISIVKNFIAEYQPKIITFTAMKENGNQKPDSRTKLYSRIIQKMATKLGYRHKVIDNIASDANLFVLEKID